MPICTVAFYTVLKTAIFEMEWLDFKSIIIRSFLSSGCQDHIFRNVLTAIFCIIYIFIEVNEQIKRLSLVITSFQVLL